MEKTLKIINQMQEEGLFSTYAIGGGIAALFYIEPIATFDLDIFVIISEPSGDIVTLSSLYEWLEKRGYKPQNEQIVIEGVPVQFIPVYNDLVKDAVDEAVEHKYANTQTKVLKPEHLIVIMLQTFRPKDKDRLIRFLDESDISGELLDSILMKHGLKDTFDKFRSQYYG